MDEYKTMLRPDGAMPAEQTSAAVLAETQAQTPALQVIGTEECRALTAILMKYKSGKNSVDQRVREAERWWKLRNTVEEKKTDTAGRKGFRARSGWLHNVITSKHADAMDGYPEPNILPREEGDKPEAEKLSKIVPVVLERENFERTYSDAWWQKLKTGTGVYKIVWDKNKLGGLGDISVTRVSLLNLFWQPGVEDIQESKYFFEVSYQDKDTLAEAWPQLDRQKLGRSIITAEQATDDNIDRENQVPVISAYYRKNQVLHYVMYVDETVLYATENDPDLAQKGIYAHGKFPYVFDPLFPVDCSPCGYGFVDLCQQPQTEIDLLKTAAVTNAMNGSRPRYFMRQGSGINKNDFLNLENPIVEVPSMNADAIQPINTPNLDGAYITMLQESIQELRETSSNTDAATGTTPSGVTAASAIAALQEASGKTSRDSTQSAYRAYRQVVDLCIELIRQFYDLPRQFRIVGERGAEQYITYTSAGIQPEAQTGPNGENMGYRLPVFDIRVVPQKRSAYTKMANNELALQFFQLGFFNPEATDSALACLEMMDFDGKDAIIKMIQRNGTMFEKFQLLLQYAATMAQQYNDLAAMQQIAAMAGVGMGTGMESQTMIAGQQNLEPTAEPKFMRNARQTARGSAIPDEGGGAQ